MSTTITYNLVSNKGSTANTTEDIISELFKNRGVNSSSVFKDTLIHFSLLDSVSLATELLYEYIIQRKKICVVADYDSDGATSCAIAFRGLKMLGADIHFIVPNRFVHGYGLTIPVVDEAITLCNPDLILTVDNGISSFDGINYCISKGIKTIVTDHHLSGSVLPNADAIVNPNKFSCDFPSKNLAGCGVIFYLLLSLKEYFVSKDISYTNVPIFSLVDFVAIGTIADLVKLDSNNLLLVKYGLDRIRSGKSFAGIYSLIQISKKLPQYLTTSDISFGIAPRLNAAGRIEDMSTGIQLLLSDDVNSSIVLAQKLDSLNQQRKSIEGDMKEVSLCDSTTVITDFSAISYHDTYHEGVIGILASRLKELHYKPSIVFSDCSDAKFIKGSCRSISGIHMRDIIESVNLKDSNIISKFGGHAMAAGLTINKDRFVDFVSLFNESVSEVTTDISVYVNNKFIDIELYGNNINYSLVKYIELHVWGQNYTEPVFVSTCDILSQRIINNQHSKLQIKIGEYNFDAMFFNFSELLDDSISHRFIYTLSFNRFRDRESIQLLISDLLR